MLVSISEYIAFFVDDQLLGEIPTGEGYYKRGNFSDPNIWAKGEPDAPFDQEVIHIFGYCQHLLLFSGM